MMVTWEIVTFFRLAWTMDYMVQGTWWNIKLVLKLRVQPIGIVPEGIDHNTRFKREGVIV